MTDKLTARANALTDVHSPRKLAKMLILATEELEQARKTIEALTNAPRKTSRNDTQGRDQG